MRRYWIFPLLAAVLGYASLSSIAAAPSQIDDINTLRHLKQVLWPQAYRTQDVQLLDGILADEFQMIDADGVWSSKAEELEYIRTTPPNYHSLSYAINRIEVFENGTAIIAGQGTIRGEGNNGPYVLTYQSSNVLIKRNQAWRAIASHVSGVEHQATPKSNAASNRE
ncbi:nuclear transport factor 2 family protein [Pseudomarimonas arenosa]|uniref:Nuclear transport factor 2 family protein n=1 Tax=Pseudomarimonas arenosa TaxID=2774145 RepID=A0AAW3ZMU8_9GAMM|nr:nuclear transport factor 2 family protein [Pseudomarimonas arenosa]MBD8527063.1 nuclear transport factor 2 family protein [Pseudomarimonas arenosa]